VLEEGVSVVLFSSEASSLSDIILCERASSGDPLAFQMLIRRYAPLMRAYAIRLTGNRQDADDVLQETFIKAWEKIHTLENPESIKSWLMKLTSRKAIDLLRARKLTVELEVAADTVHSGASPEESAITDSQMIHLAGLLKALPLDQQQVWIMREVGGSTYQEISEILKITEATVRGRLARARATLVRGMEGWD